MNPLPRCLPFVVRFLMALGFLGMTGCPDILPSPPADPTPRPRPTATPVPLPTPVPTPTPIPIPSEVPDPNLPNATRYYEKARRGALLRTGEVQNEFFKTFPLIIPGQTVELSSSTGVEFSGKLRSYSTDFVTLEFQGQRRHIPTAELPHTQKVQIFQDLRRELVQLEAAIETYQRLKNDPVYPGDTLPRYLTYGELLEIGYPEVLLEHARLREQLGDHTYAFFVYGFLAKRNIPAAVHDLGRFYAEGIGMAPNYPRALQILKKARNLGHAASQELIDMIESVQYFEAEERDFRIITESVSVTCPTCNGSGILESRLGSQDTAGRNLPCNTCRGRGKVRKRVLKKVPLTPEP